MIYLTKFLRNNALRLKKDGFLDNVGRQALRYCGLFMMPCLFLVVVSAMKKYQHHRPHIFRRTLLSNYNKDIAIPEMIGSSPGFCQNNAIVYLVTTSKNNQENFLKSMDLLYNNYLNQNYQDTHVILFHIGNLGVEDLDQFESRYDDENLKGIIRLVNLQDSKFWGELPVTVKHDDPMQWKDYSSDLANLHTQDAMNLRHENRFWSSQVWEYFDEIMNKVQGCNYRYIMRLHPNSFLYSPIPYNIFEFMQNNDYHYGFRLCSQERHQKHLWEDFRHGIINSGGKNANDILYDDDSCLFYNPFFVADLHFFRSRPVQRLLDYVDAAGYNYRGNIPPTIVHSLAVKAYASPETIHRFLDFTFEHFNTNNNEEEEDDDCSNNHPISDGGFQAGYNDVQAESHLQEWIYLQQTTTKKKSHHCAGSDPRQEAEIQNLRFSDLSSPEYTHLPDGLSETLSLPTLVFQQQ